MPNLYDIAYWAGLTIAAPYWLLKSKTRRKVLAALRERNGNVSPRCADQTNITPQNSPAIWIHAVSLGEMNATRALIDALRESRPDLSFIVSTTTTTGYARGEQLYGIASHVTLIRYPLDFSSSINRALDALRPSLVVLMELEIWPNFVLQCHKRGIPVMIANGRITEPSFRKYMWIKPVTTRMMRRLALVCVQDQTYAERFTKMGALPDRVQITGTMKFDTATVADRVDGDAELANAVELKPEALGFGDERVLLAGSTGPGEEAIALDVYKELLPAYPNLRLAIVPRHPERFDEVADLIRAKGFRVVRRSEAKNIATQSNATTTPNPHLAGSLATRVPTDVEDRVASDPAKPELTEAVISDSIPPVILGDTMGELRKFYSLSTIVFVGRSLVDLGPRQHGSDMIEPAALAKPVLVGPHTSNFADAMLKFRAANAIIEIESPLAMQQAITQLLADAEKRQSLGQRAQDVVRREKGATARHAREILVLLHGQP